MRVGMPVTAPTTAMTMTANMTAIMATAKVRRLASVCVPVVAWVAVGAAVVCDGLGGVLGGGRGHVSVPLGVCRAGPPDHESCVPARLCAARGPDGGFPSRRTLGTLPSDCLDKDRDVCCVDSPWITRGHWEGCGPSAEACAQM